MSASVNVFEYHSGNVISVSYCGSDVTLFHIYASWFSPPSYQGRKGGILCSCDFSLGETVVGKEDE